MIRPRLLSTLLAAALLASPAAAQLRTTFSAGPGLSRTGFSGSAAGLVLAPTAALGGERADLAVHGRFAWLSAAGDWSADLAADGDWRLRPAGALRPEVGAEGRAVSLPGGERAARTLARARLRAGSRAAHAWVGAGAGAAWGDSLLRPVAALEAGAALRLAGGTLRVETGSTWFEESSIVLRTLPDVGPDTLGPDTTVTLREESRRRRSYTDARLAYRWAGGRLALDASVGVRLRRLRDPSPEVWGDAGATFALTGRTTLAAGWGIAPGLPEMGTRRAQVGTLALRVNPGPLRRPAPLSTPAAAAPEAEAAFEARPAGPGQYELVLRPGPAATVEVQGDFSDWQAVAMAPRADGSWSVRIALPAGTYRLNVRVDGGPWSAPAGLPAVADDFGGMVGLLVLDGSSG